MSKVLGGTLRREAITSDTVEEDTDLTFDKWSLLEQLALLICKMLFIKLSIECIQFPRY